MVSGTVNAESVGLHKDHNSLVKYGSEGDRDFSIVANYLSQMAQTAPQEIEGRWTMCHQREGKLIFCFNLYKMPSNWLPGTVDIDNRPEIIYTPCRPLSSRFTGQDLYIARLRDVFALPTGKMLSKRVALFHGPRGVGKTQISLKFAEDSSNDRR